MQKHEGWMDRGWGILGYRHNDEILHLSLLCICSWDVLHLFHHLLPTYCQALFTIIYLKRHNLTTKEIQLFCLTISCFWPVLLWRIWYNLHKVHRFVRLSVARNHKHVRAHGLFTCWNGIAAWDTPHTFTCVWVCAKSMNHRRYGIGR